MTALKDHDKWKPDSFDKHTPRPPPKGDVNAIPWVPDEARPLVFTNGNIVDVAANKILKGHTLVIAHGAVQSVEKASFVKWPSDHRVIDCSGLYLCPGLTDCHVHINMSDGRMQPYTDPHLRATYTLKCMLARGFTTVRDVGGATFFQKQAIEQWLTPGPRLFQGGDMISQTGGHGDPRPREVDGCCGEGGRLVDGVPEATRAARDLMRKGADHVKIATSGGVSSPTDKLDSVQLSPDEIRAIVDVVRDMGGTGVTSHAYTSPAIRRAVDNGVRGIEHGNLLDRETAKLLAKKGVFLTPTLMISTAKGRPPWNETLPDYMREKNAMVRDAGRKAIQIADEEGVCICYGTDLTMGMGYLQSEEFTQRAQLLPSPKVLAHATINAALNLEDKRIGRLEPGAYGDVLVLTANPLEDVRVLDSGKKGIWGVVKDGRVVVARKRVREQVGLDVVLGVEEAE